MIAEGLDAHGSRTVYRYRRDDDANLPQRLFERGHDNRANRYPDRILFGNYRASDGSENFAFQARFEYLAGEDGKWAVRRDPTSSYRAGFEIRTNRLCVAVASVRDFPAEGVADMVVGRTRFFYKPDTPLSLLDRIDYEGYRRDGEQIVSASLPATHFDYDPFHPGAGELITLRTRRGEPIPAMMDSGPCKLVDLLGDGMPGVLYADGSALGYFRPMGEGTYGGPQLLPQLPIDGFAGQQTRLHDVTGNGRCDLLVADKQRGGWYANEGEGAWSAMRTFESYTGLLADPRNELVDVAGSGRADLLVESDPAVFFRSLGTDGFAAPEPIVPDEPLPFAGDERELVTFVDVFGDGLAHRVRVRDGSVEAWPNLGNGRFDAMVAIANAPRIPPTLATSRIILADVTGTGPADLLLIDNDHVALYANHAGDHFEPEVRIALPFTVNDQDTIALADVVGDGRQRLVVSKAGPDNAHYAVPISGPGYPYQLVGVDNRMGERSTISYGSSTTFALRDRLEGRPWATTLPKPVLVVTAHEVYDEILNVRRIARYAYANGFFDGVEREFRGFGSIERTSVTILPDREPTESSRTRSWFDTGAFAAQRRIAQSEHVAYFHDPEALTLAAFALDPALETADAGTLRHAYRALSGRAIREELYAAGDHVPLQVTQTTPLVRLVQPALDGTRPVFQVIDRETAAAAYDPSVVDPRAFDPHVEYTATLATTPYGNPTVTAQIFYPRRHLPDPAPPEQGIRQVIAGLQDWIDRDEVDWLAIGVAYQNRSFQAEGLADPLGRYYTYDELGPQVEAALAHRLDYGQPFTSGPQARRYAWSQHFFWNEEQNAPLPLGQTTSRQLAHHQRNAIFPIAFVETPFGTGRVSEAMLRESGGYESDLGHWWNPSSVIVYADAASFFLPRSATTPFASTTTVEYDAYALLPIRQTDAFGNQTHVENDYQAFAVRAVTDINGNVQEALFDPLSRVIAATQWSLKNGAPVGNLPLAEYRPIWNASAHDVLEDPARFVQGASSYCLYDLGAWMTRVAPRTIEIQRVDWVHGDLTHAQSAAGQLRITVTAHNGSGKTVLVKARTEGEAAGQPAPFVWHADDGVIPGPDTTPLREYLPYFSPTPDFPDGVSDPIRVTSSIRSGERCEPIRPKASISRTCIGLGRSNATTKTSTVITSPYYIEHINDPNLPPLEREALEKAAAFNDTPTTVELDVQGREFVQHRIGYDDQTPPTFKRLTSLAAYDIAGNQTVTIDPRFYAQRFSDPVENIFTYFDMTGTMLATRSCDVGKSEPGWMRTLTDATGNVIFSWNNRGDRVEQVYGDTAHKLLMVRVTDTTGATRVSETYAYGNDPNANTVEEVVEHRDEAGVHRFEAFSLLGSMTRSSVRLVAAYIAPVDWNDPDVPMLPQTWRYRASIDAVGQDIEQDQADGSAVLRPFSNGWPRSVDARFAGATDFVTVASKMTYSIRAGRTAITYGNGVLATESFEELTGAITGVTARQPDGAYVQNLSYVYDPVGNVTSRASKPGGLRTHKNVVIDPVARYISIRSTGSSGQPVRRKKGCVCKAFVRGRRSVIRARWSTIKSRTATTTRGISCTPP